MKVGGNASASDFFNKHGVSSLLSDVDTKKKYSSRVGELYREELARRVKDDVAKSVFNLHSEISSIKFSPFSFTRFPNGIVVDGMGPAAAIPKEETEDDFFDSWSKPSTPKSSNPGTPRISTPPIIGRSVSAVATTTNTNSTSPPIPTPTSPRTLTSSAAARPARLGGTSRLNSASSGGSVTSTAPKKSKLGLGAAKAKPVDFAEAERKAIEEAERIKQLGYDREREEKEEKARKETEALKRAQELASRVGIAAANTTLQATTNGGNRSNTVPQKAAAFPRLGFGAIPGAGAAAAVAAVPTSSKAKYTSFFFFSHLFIMLIFFDRTFAVSHPSQTTHPQLLVTNSETKKGYLQICILDETLTTLILYVRLKLDFNPSKELLPYLPINTLEGKKKKKG
jgi:ADP-ribosylation factor GTPase-activating protein 2/3